MRRLAPPLPPTCTARVFAALAGLALCACGSGGDSDTDAGSSLTDAVFVPPECDIDFGFTYVFDSLWQFPEGEGVDIDDDGLPDNHLAKLRPLFNASLEDGFERGTWIFLMEVTNWAGPPAEDDDDVSIVVYNGFDADSPPNTENDFGGQGEFLVDSRQLDVRCQPQDITHGGTIAQRVLHVRPEEWRFQIEGIGVFPYVDMRMTAEFAPDFSTFTGRAGGDWPPCGLYKATGPQYVGGNLLGQVVNHFALPDPDIDRDGHGLEYFVGDGTSIVECVDGDGTILPGPDCACDPRIVDGYSVSFELTGVTADIVGILQVD